MNKLCSTCSRYNVNIQCDECFTPTRIVIHETVVQPKKEIHGTNLLHNTTMNSANKGLYLMASTLYPEDTSSLNKAVEMRYKIDHLRFIMHVCATYEDTDDLHRSLDLEHLCFRKQNGDRLSYAIVRKVGDCLWIYTSGAAAVQIGERLFSNYDVNLEDACSTTRIDTIHVSDKPVVILNNAVEAALAYRPSTMQISPEDYYASCCERHVPSLDERLAHEVAYWRITFDKENK